MSELIQTIETTEDGLQALVEIICSTNTTGDSEYVASLTNEDKNNKLRTLLVTETLVDGKWHEKDVTRDELPGIINSLFSITSIKTTEPVVNQISDYVFSLRQSSIEEA